MTTVASNLWFSDHFLEKIKEMGYIINYWIVNQCAEFGKNEKLISANVIELSEEEILDILKTP